MMSTRPDPLADLAEAVGSALLAFADSLRSAPEPAAAPPSAEPDTAAGGQSESAGPDRSKLGGKQLEILAALTEAGDAGLTSAQVAERTNVGPSNAPRALNKLLDRGLVTKSADAPALWTPVAKDGAVH